MVNKSKQTIGKTINELSKLGYNYHQDGSDNDCYFNEDNNSCIYVNFQEVGYPTLFEVNFFEENWKTKKLNYSMGYRCVGMKQLKEGLIFKTENPTDK
jgi:hypothetical protein